MNEARADDGAGARPAGVAARVVFVVAAFASLAVVAVAPSLAPPVALVVGVVVAFAVGSPFPGLSGTGAKRLLQVAVALLGFRVDLPVMLEATLEGGPLAVATIGITLALGIALGAWMGVAPRVATLVSGGTAICGGSAIAAIAPAIRAKNDEIAVALGTVFLLNAVALLVFPPLGHLLELTPEQFGVWAGIAIHDVSSVAGAAQAFDPAASDVAMTVKLSRALWIVPVAVAAGWWWNRRHAAVAAESDVGSAADGGPPVARLAGKRPPIVPWFIAAFVLASVLRAVLVPLESPAIDATLEGLVLGARWTLVLVLYLIGTGLSLAALRAVGVRPLVLGVLLWIAIAGASLGVVVGL